jgi:hypothetical protein
MLGPNISAPLRTCWRIDDVLKTDQKLVCIESGVL